MRQVIITKREQAAAGFTFDYLLWASVPAGRQHYVAAGQATGSPSLIPEATAGNGDGGLTAQELTDFRAGKFMEMQNSGQWPSLAAAQSDLQLAWADFANLAAGNAPYTNTWLRYGSSWDGTSWSLKANNT